MGPEAEAARPPHKPAKDPRSAAAREVLALGAILAVALGIQQGCAAGHSSLAQWGRLVLPGAWLLAASIAWLRRRPIAFTLGRGGRRTWWAGLAALALAVVLVLMAAYWPAGGAPVNLGSVGRWAALVLLVPVAEEVFFRGLLLDHLVRTVGAALAIILVSALFGLLHWPQGLFWPMAILSIVLCATTLTTRSVLWAVALHGAWNALAVVRLLATGWQRLAIAALTAALLLAMATWGVVSRARAES